MLIQALAVFNFDHGQPATSLDLTGAFGPFSAEVGIGLAVAILAVAILTAVFDSWWGKRQIAQPTALMPAEESQMTAHCEESQMTVHCKAA
jgi:hypothetical protein